MGLFPLNRKLTDQYFTVLGREITPRLLLRGPGGIASPARKAARRKGKTRASPGLLFHLFIYLFFIFFLNNNNQTTNRAAPATRTTENHR